MKCIIRSIEYPNCNKLIKAYPILENYNAQILKFKKRFNDGSTRCIKEIEIDVENPFNLYRDIDMDIVLSETVLVDGFTRNCIWIHDGYLDG